MPPKKPRATYARSKWDDFNKFAATFIFNEFENNLTKFKNIIKWLGPNTKESHYLPLTNWFLGLPRTQLRTQKIVSLAFIDNYEYKPNIGTRIKKLG